MQVYEFLACFKIHSDFETDTDVLKSGFSPLHGIAPKNYYRTIVEMNESNYQWYYKPTLNVNLLDVNFQTQHTLIFRLKAIRHSTDYI